MNVSTVRIDAMNFPQFRRLVDFLCEINDYAHREVFLDLEQLCADCYEDLTQFRENDV